MKKIVYLLLIIPLFVSNSCSINQFATRIVADTLTGNSSGSVFMTDEDPEFIADALPFALKTFESLLQSDPGNHGLIEALASGYISYANGFLQSPAELLGDEEYVEQHRLLERAAAMYRRGGNYANMGLELISPGFNDAFEEGSWKTAFKNLESDSIPYLYWKAASVLGEFSVDSFNPKLMMEIPGSVALVVKALELNEDYNSGAIHDLLISVFANIPEGLIYRSIEPESGYFVREILAKYYNSHGLSSNFMSQTDQVLFHLESSVKLSKGYKASPYVSTASIYIVTQDLESFKSILNKALAIDVNIDPENRLVNIISQRKARWLLENIDENFFIY